MYIKRYNFFKKLRFWRPFWIFNIFLMIGYQIQCVYSNQHVSISQKQHLIRVFYIIYIKRYAYFNYFNVGRRPFWKKSILKIFPAFLRGTQELILIWNGPTSQIHYKCLQNIASKMKQNIIK